MIPGKTYTPLELAQAAWRRRWWIASSCIVLAAVAFAVVMTLPRSYRSLATLQIVSEPASDAYVRTTAQPPVADRLSSIGQATLTRSRLEAIVTDLDLYPEMRQSTVMENVIESMRGDITFTSTDRDVFVLGFTSKDPFVAHAVATRLTSLFLEENARDRGQRAEAATQFLDAQLEEVRQRLGEQEQRIEAYKAQYAGHLPSQLTSNLQELNNAQATLRSVLESVNRDQGQRLTLQLELASADAVVPSASLAGISSPGDSPMADQPGVEVDQLETAQATLRAIELRLTPEHPDVQKIKRVIARLERQQSDDQAALAGGATTSSSLRRRDPQRSRGIRGQIEVLDHRIAANEVEARRLRARIDDHTRRIDATPVREAELATLSRDYEDTKKQYSSLTARQQEASMAMNLESKAIGDRFRIIEPAQVPEKPISQSRTSNLMIGLLIALGFSLGLGAFIEYRDSSLRSDADVSMSLRLPVLATIPDLNRRAFGRSRQGYMS